MVDHFDPLQTSRLDLVPISAQVARLIADGDVAGLGVADGWPQVGTKNGISLAIEHGQPPGWLVRYSGQVIGDCGIRAPVDGFGCVEIGYGLADPYQGQGFGTEVVVAISDWLLAQPHVSTVRGCTLPSNAASRRVLEKAGFTLVGTREDESVYERRPDRTARGGSEEEHEAGER